MKQFLKCIAISLLLMISSTYPLRDVTLQQLDTFKKELSNTSKIIKDLNTAITRAKSNGDDISKTSITINKKIYDLTAQSLLNLRQELITILNKIENIDPVQRSKLEQDIQEDLATMNTWTSNGYVSTRSIITGSSRGDNKFKTLEYTTDGISENRNTLLQIKDWFTAAVGSLKYNDAINTASALLDGQIKVLEQMIKRINITYPISNNKTDDLVIVTAEQIQKVFDVIDNTIKEIGEIKTANGGNASDIEAIKQQINTVKKKRVSYLYDIICKIGNDSTKTQALGMYLKEKRLDYWTVKSNVIKNLADLTGSPVTLDQNHNGSLLNLAKNKQTIGDHMLHYQMLAQESSYFVDSIEVLAVIAKTFKQHFNNSIEVKTRGAIQNALETNLYKTVHIPLINQSAIYLGMLGSYDDKLSSSNLNNTDTGVDTLSNKEFYNKKIVAPLKDIANSFAKWTDIHDNMLKPIGITINNFDADKEKIDEYLAKNFKDK